MTGEPGVGKTELLDAASGGRVRRRHSDPPRGRRRVRGRDKLLRPEPGPPAAPGCVAAAPGGPPRRPQRRARLRRGRAPSRLVVSNAALVLLRQAATARPLLVIIDDLPWLDRASAGVLSFVARRLEGSQVGLLGASRTGEEDFFERAGLPELEVQPLDDVAARQLLDTRFPDLGADRSRTHPRRGTGEPARAVGASRRARPGDARIRQRRCLPPCRSVDGSRRSSDRGSPSFRLGRGSSCCSWRSMAPETYASWRRERRRTPAFAISPRRSRHASRTWTRQHTGSRSTTPSCARPSWICRRPKNVEPRTACWPTCGRTSQTAGRGISPRRPSSRTSPWRPSSKPRRRGSSPEATPSVASRR